MLYLSLTLLIPIPAHTISHAKPIAGINVSTLLSENNKLILASILESLYS